MIFKEQKSNRIIPLLKTVQLLCTDLGLKSKLHLAPVCILCLIFASLFLKTDHWVLPKESGFHSSLHLLLHGMHNCCYWVLVCLSPLLDLRVPRSGTIWFLCCVPRCQAQPPAPRTLTSSRWMQAQITARLWRQKEPPQKAPSPGGEQIHTLIISLLSKQQMCDRNGRFELSSKFHQGALLECLRFLLIKKSCFLLKRPCLRWVEVWFSHVVFSKCGGYFVLCFNKLPIQFTWESCRRAICEFEGLKEFLLVFTVYLQWFFNLKSSSNWNQELSKHDLTYIPHQLLGAKIGIVIIIFILKMVTLRGQRANFPKEWQLVKQGLESVFQIQIYSVTKNILSSRLSTIWQRWKDIPSKINVSEAKTIKAGGNFGEKTTKYSQLRHA